MNFQADSLKNKFKSVYNELEPRDKAILQICALMGPMCTQAQVFECLKKSDLPEKLKLESQVQVRIYLGHLEKNGLMDYGCCVLEEYRELAAMQAMLEGQVTLLGESLMEALGTSVDAQEDSFTSLFRKFRVGIYWNRPDMWKPAWISLMDDYDVEPFTKMLRNPFDPEFFDKLPHEVQNIFLFTVFERSFSSFGDDTPELSYVMEHLFPDEMFEREQFNLAFLLVFRLLFAGRVNEALDVSRRLEKRGFITYFSSLEMVLKGKLEPAVEGFLEDMKKSRNPEGTPVSYLDSTTGILYCLALILDGSPACLELAEKNIDLFLGASPDVMFTDSPWYFLNQLLNFRIHELSDDDHPEFADEIPYDFNLDSSEDLFSMVISCLGQIFRTSTIDSYAAVYLLQGYERAMANGHLWAALEFAELLEKSGNGTPEIREAAESIKKETGFVSLVSHVKVKEVWEKKLDELLALDLDKKVSGEEESRSRLVWFIHENENDSVSLIAKIQKLSKKGKWSKGRKVDIKSLYEGEGLDFMSPFDRKICSAIDQTGYFYSDRNYMFDPGKLYKALVGHPLVFLDENNPVPVEVVSGEPEVLVKKDEEKLRIEFGARVGDGVVITRETPTRFKVIEYSETHRALYDVIGDAGLTVPDSEKKRILKAVEKISRIVTIQSEIGGGDARIPNAPGNPQPRVHLCPSGDGFSMEMYVTPFEEGGPFLKPGKGGASVISEIKGKRIRADRDLEKEISLAEEVVSSCPSLESMEEGYYQWMLSDAEACLELLLDLQVLQKEKSIIVEWPEGEKLKTTTAVGTGNFSLKINRKTDWFELSGQLETDTGMVLDLKEMLRLSQMTSSRFIPMGEGQFLALTEKLKRRLGELSAFTELHGKSVMFHPSAAMVMDDISEDFQLTHADAAWKKRVKRLREGEKYTTSVPSTLKAELRDYQEEGFTWLSRLAFWGMGACLADDMGLGKTLQCISVILSRAPQGPSLVVAPTSVCDNWIDEISRFAPTLNPVLFGNGNRRASVEALSGMDIMVISYGLMQQELALIEDVDWNTIVLDEAQAIKNASTKRSRAARKLKGDFRIITTGTPIENHLGELKNLFDFINPGLLGSDKKFNTVFAGPIEKRKDRAASSQLKKLIRPFVLRRLKSQVLEELPPKTEVVLHVEMSREEASFYEALRHRAVEELASGNSLEKSGERHLRILAEITRLRRACCNPSLVEPGAHIESSKMKQFGELVDELLENRHKVLVFSQFTSHLAILRKFLDEKGVDYRYLDGSTPARARKKEVDAFQAGEGDLFLISLKAGGTGLNLTAASYVIHMDPWWNPAVEDQASDRAHRIGQEHPVTVYRLVAKNTIEEKIVKLHGEKRDLAENLLDGSDVTGKISAEQLMELIKK